MFEFILVFAAISSIVLVFRLVTEAEDELTEEASDETE